MAMQAVTPPFSDVFAHFFAPFCCADTDFTYPKEWLLRSGVTEEKVVTFDLKVPNLEGTWDSQLGLAGFPTRKNYSLAFIEVGGMGWDGVGFLFDGLPCSACLLACFRGGCPVKKGLHCIVLLACFVATLGACLP